MLPFPEDWTGAVQPGWRAVVVFAAVVVTEVVGGTSVCVTVVEVVI